MIEAPLAFDGRRARNELAQPVLYLQLANEVIVLAQSGVTGLAEAVLWKADGSKKANGSVKAGAPVETVLYSLLEVSDLSEGDTGEDDPVGVISELPPSRVSFVATLDNATGRISALRALESPLGKACELRLTYPQLSPTAMVIRARAEVVELELADDRAYLHVEGA